jgi:hypothetical protein
MLKSEEPYVDALLWLNAMHKTNALFLILALQDTNSDHSSSTLEMERKKWLEELTSDSW